MTSTPTSTLDGSRQSPSTGATITGGPDDYDALLDLVGDRSFVLIGEASHGTHDFYRERARITRRLIDECGFTAVAVEADWPDAYRVNRYVMGLSNDPDANTALSDFRRFPAWMWRNRDVLSFVEWLRARNDAHRHQATKARFYGLDLYSLRASMEAVVEYLDRVDPEEARRARERYSCFDARRWRRAGVRLRARVLRSDPLRERGRRPAHRVAPAGRTRTCAVMAGSPRTSSSSPNRTPVSCVTPRSTTNRCTAPRFRRGIFATGTWRAHSTPSPRTSTTRCLAPRSSCGSTTHTSVTRGRRKWAYAVSSTSDNSLDSATGATACWSASPPSTAR